MPTYRHKPVDFVIDVRSKLEFWLGHLGGAKCMPVSSIADTIDSVPGITKKSRILLYCASGARSAMAAGILKSQGYVSVVDGGALASARRDFIA
jgi:rhodanese-related sulfurtransferase